MSIARWFLIDENTSYLAGFGLALLLSGLAIAITRRASVAAATDAAAQARRPPKAVEKVPQAPSARESLRHRVGRHR